MRTLLLAAAAAFAFASVTTGATADPQGPFHLDHSGKCHDATGKFVPPALCNPAPPAVPPGPYKLDAKGRCHAANGRFVAARLCKH